MQSAHKKTKNQATNLHKILPQISILVQHTNFE